MFYPRFTKIIIHHFLDKDNSIPMRNRTFMHTARDDSLLDTMRFVSKHADTQVYGSIIPKSMTNQASLDSIAYKTYYAFASGKKSAKAKKVAATKPKPTKKKAPIKADRGKSDGTDFESGVPNEQHRKTSGTDKGTDNDDEDDTKDDKGNDDNDDSDGNDDDDVNDDDNQEDDDTNDDEEETNNDRTELDIIKIHVLNQSSTEYYEEEEEENTDDEETMDEEDDDESGFEQVEEDAHVTLTPVLDTQKTDEPIQSSSVTSDFTSKLLNLENPSLADNEIASLMNSIVLHEEPRSQTSSLYTIPVTATPEFIDKVSNLEKGLSEIKQVDQYAQPLSSIPTIVDHYIDNKLREAIQKAIVAHNLDCREEAKAEKSDYIELKNVTESLEAAGLARSSSQPKSTYQAAALLSEFELTKILIDKMEKNKSYDKADYKRELYVALVKSYQTDKDLFDTYGEVFTLKRSQDDKDKDQDPSVGSDRGSKRRKSRKEAESSTDSRSKEKKSSSTSKDASHSQHKSSGKSTHTEEPSKPYLFDLSKPLPLIPDHQGRQVIPRDFFINNDLKYLKGGDLSRGYSTSVTKTKAATYEIKWIEDLKLTNLTIDERYDLNVESCMFTRRIVIQRRVEDLQLGVESYQKKLNLTKPDTFRSNLRNRTTYKAYSDPKGVIYKDQNNKNRLIRADELNKFSDGTLNNVRTALHDIASGIRMEYLPKRKWSGLDKRSARVMV
ncbi:hypothetical protein Tco_1019743 [Tanacetum coccineum]|uniref:Uncharacterized protein n=1 Tax=Tanacetum coccineum TaxID=301880 RepID=A0ABQ5FY28_9ASTR